MYEIIKPAIRGKDISKYNYHWPGIWVILVKSGWTNENRGSEDPETYFKSQYPSIYKHFKNVSENFNGKGKGLYNRDDQGDYWWELRPCVYYQEFAKEKIIWGELSDKAKFAYDKDGHFANNTIFMMTGLNLMYILSIFNSRLGKWYFDKIATSSGMGTNRWLKYKIEQLPIKNISKDNEHIVNQIEAFVNQAIDDSENNSLLTKIDSLIYELYELTPEEKSLVENSHGA